MSRRFALALPFILVSLAIALEALWAVSAATNNRPFWTEKSMFAEGDELFVVGVASHAQNIEEGRQKAFEHGKIELMNYAQVTDLEAQGLVIETQMTYEEPTPNGTFTVYRLLRVRVATLLAIQGRVTAHGRAQEQSLDAHRRELLAIQQSIAHKQQELDSRARRIEEQQREIEQLVKQVTASGVTSPPPPTGASGVNRWLEWLEQADTRLAAREKAWDEAFAGFFQLQLERVKREQKEYQARCEQVARGMTVADVQAIMGEPDEIRTDLKESGEILPLFSIPSDGSAFWVRYRYLRRGRVEFARGVVTQVTCLQ